MFPHFIVLHYIVFHEIWVSDIESKSYISTELCLLLFSAK